MSNNEVPPTMPPRPADQQYQQQHPIPPPQPQQPSDLPPYNPQDYAGQPVGDSKLQQPPAERISLEQHDVSSPIHFTRDPHKLIGYLVPFPKPELKGIPADRIPQRFLIYTPPPPPFMAKPKEGEKEGKVHKAQRKWMEELREAKMGNAKTASWKGIKGKVTKGINWGMSATKTSNLEFLNRIAGMQDAEEADTHGEDNHPEGTETKKTIKLEEMLLIYPADMPGSQETIRQEFVNTMLRSKSKAERDSIIATGLLPVSLAIDVLATLIWPFGGLLEIDAVWLYSSVRGAKTSRSVTKRLTSTSTSGNHDTDKLALNFAPAPQIAILQRYLAAKCHEKDKKLFPHYASSPSETEVLEAIGWFPSSKGGEEKNWEDEQWEILEVKDDLKSTMMKGAREWGKWVRVFEEKPEKALKK